MSYIFLITKSLDICWTQLDSSLLCFCYNKTMESYHKKPLTIAQARKFPTFDQLTDDPETNARLNRIETEFARGFEFIDSLPKTVSIFGSTRTKVGTAN